MPTPLESLLSAVDEVLEYASKANLVALQKAKYAYTASVQPSLPSETKLDTDVTVTCSACGHQTTAHTHSMPRPTPLPAKYFVSSGMELATSHQSLDAAMREADRLRFAYPDTRILIHRYNADGSNPVLVLSAAALARDGVREVR